MQDIDPNNIFVLDESGANLSMTRDYARAFGGSRAKHPKPHNIKQNYSIIAVISILQIIAINYIENAVNADIFKVFIKKSLVPKLKKGCYVVLDNVNFHKDTEIRQMIEATGASLVFLPPYSPDLSPIEKMWSKIKIILKKYKPRTPEEFHNALSNATCEITDDDLENWYEECGYNIAA